MSVNSFSGKIPIELGNLADLEYLDVGGNSLSGTIPAHLGNLSKLIVLGLGNGFCLEISLPSLVSS